MLYLNSNQFTIWTRRKCVKNRYLGCDCTISTSCKIQWTHLCCTYTYICFAAYVFWCCTHYTNMPHIYTCDERVLYFLMYEYMCMNILEGSISDSIYTRADIFNKFIHYNLTKIYIRFVYFLTSKTYNNCHRVCMGISKYKQSSNWVYK